MRAFVNINLDNYIYNLNKIVEKIDKDKIMCILKADAYGHGVERIYLESLKYGISNFGVASLEEALELRKLDENSNILVLGLLEFSEIKKAIENDIDVTISSFDEIEYILKEKLDKKNLFHFALDTGMGRIGFSINEIDEAIKKLIPKAIFTHLSSADSDDEYTKYQNDKFKKIREKYKNIVKIFHITNSFGSLKEIESDLHRIGILLYGAEKTEIFKPVMSLNARITYLKKLKEDTFIGYSKTYKAKKGDIIATISIGYADGILRSMSNKSKVYFNGKKYRIIGNICMDQLMVLADETFKVGKYVEIFGDNIKVRELAEELGTISYELLCMIKKRVKKFYKGGINNDN